MSFGYFDDLENRRVLENVCASLVPGGVFVLDLVGREIAASRPHDSPWQEVDGVRYREIRSIPDDVGSMVSEWTVLREGTRAKFRVEQRLYTGQELRDLLQSVGFAGVRIAGALDGSTPYDGSARRLVAVARAPRV